MTAVAINDNYELESGRIYVTGTQALIRLLLIQRRRGLAVGLNTAGFISGYRGSPMAVVDQQRYKDKPDRISHQVMR